MDFVLSFGRTTFASLAIRNYRLYFIGQAISLSGTWMQTVALGWLVLTVTGSGSQLGLVTALQFLPMLLLGPYGGVVVDRSEKKKILFITQIFYGVFAGILSIIVFLGATKLWMLYIFAVSFGLVRVFENPARQTFVNELVGGDRLKNAISLNATANNLARAVGPSIGGIIIATAGIAFCFLFNALSYIATMVMLSKMRDEELIRGTGRKHASGDLVSGLRYAWSTPLIRNLLIMMAVVGTFSYEFQVSLPILAQQTFLGNAGDYATLMAAFGVGSVIGGLFSAGRHQVAMSHYVLAVFMFGVSILGTSVAPSLQVATIGMVIVGIFSINVTSLANTMIQLKAAPEMRGRIMALWSVAMIGSTPIGGPIVGWVGEHIGARWGLVIGGTAAVLVGVYAFFALLKRDTALEGEVGTAEESAEVELENIKVR